MSKDGSASTSSNLKVLHNQLGVLLLPLQRGYFSALRQLHASQQLLTIQYG